MLDILKKHIKSYPKVKPDYFYENENGINPVYYDLDHAPLVSVGETRIWVLRSDFIFALGIKNVYTSIGNVRINTKIHPDRHNDINILLMNQVVAV